MRILIFGHSGYIGQALFHKLSEFHDVHGASRHLINVDKEYVVDISNKDAFLSINKLTDVDVVVICSAMLPQSTYDSDHIKKLFEVNIIGVNNIVSWSKKVGVRKVIYLSSLSIIDNSAFNDGIVTEETRKYNQSNHCWYSFSKLGGELAIEREFKNTAYNYIILRLSSVYGGENLQNGVLKSFISLALNGKNLIVNNSYDNADFIHLNDVIKAINSAIKSDFNGIINVASGKPITMLELAQKIVRIFNIKVQIEVLANEIKPKKMFSIVRMKKELGIANFIRIEEGINGLKT